MNREVSNSDDVIDSRDVIARIEELTELKNNLKDARDEFEKDPSDDNRDSLDNVERFFDEEQAEELKALESLAEEAEGYSEDWIHGSTLIRDSYFTAYAQELCEDIGDVPKNLPSYIAIDWDATANNIQADYTSVDFDGVTYWIR